MAPPNRPLCLSIHDGPTWAILEDHDVPLRRYSEDGGEDEDAGERFPRHNAVIARGISDVDRVMNYVAPSLNRE